MLAVMTPPRSSLSRFFRNPRSGDVVVAQAPNAAILLWLGARGLALVWDEHEQELRWIGTGALMVWALDEVARGASPFRRVLGALVLGFQVVALVR